MSGWETVTVREISEGAAAKTVFFSDEGKGMGETQTKEERTVEGD